ncbi:MAG: hypothetical protein HQ595_02525, partial [Candidatus Omnitrophica bacterium]|nr:hypothetical protein [Candidatus Omnitrophota bacterium]
MKKAVFLSVFSALLLILSFPKPDLGFLAWVALVPWLFALQKKTPREAFLLSYLVGLLFFSGIVYWVNLVSSLGFSIMVFYLAVYFGLFGLLASRFTTHHSRVAIFAIPCLWVALEFIR